MHELSIMESALTLALERAQDSGASRILALHLRVGALSGAAPEALEFAFECLAPGTLAEGARLEIEDVPARFWCAHCHSEFLSDDMFGDCPDCGQPSGDLRSGRGLELGAMEIEPGAAAGSDEALHRSRNSLWEGD